MIQFIKRRRGRSLIVTASLIACLGMVDFGSGDFGVANFGLGGTLAHAETATPGPSAPPGPVPPAPKAATPETVTPSSPTPPSVTPPAPPPAAPPVTEKTPAAPVVPTPTVPGEKAPLGTETGPPDKTQIEPNAAPGIPDNATTENVNVPARAILMVNGQSSYDDAFKSIKASIDSLTATVAKAGLTPNGHPITIFSEPDDSGFKYKAAIPLSAKPSKDDFGGGILAGASPAGKAIKFQHRGAYDDIDSTYDVITAYLDAKGLQTGGAPYIEEYLNDLKSADDPNLQVDIYVFVK